MLNKSRILFGVVLVLLVGLLNVLPPFLIWLNTYNSGNLFLLAQQTNYKDEFFQYLPRAKEVFDGHFPPAGVYANETGLSPLNPLPPLIFSLFLRLFDGNINGAYLTAQFFFGSLIFLLFFVLGFVLFKSQSFALFFSLVGVLTQIPQFLFRYYDRDFLGIVFKKFIPIVKTPISKMYLARMDDPMLTFPFLLASLFFLYFFWIKPRIITALLAGLFSGLLAYVYLHYWLFVTVFIGIMLLLMLGLKSEKLNPKPYFILGATFFLILVPYFINYFNFISLDSAVDYAFRLGKETNRFLIWEYLKSPSGFTIVINQFIYLSLLGLIYFFYLKKTNNSYRKKKGIFFLGLILTMFLVWHLPLLTGFGFALAHFNKPINLIVFTILFDIGYEIFKNIRFRFSYFGRVIILGVIILSLSLSVKHIINTIIFLQPPPDQLSAYYFPEEIVSSWYWSNINITGESRIVSDSLVTSLYLASYTSLRPYLATGFISGLSNSELENRFYVSNKLFRVPGEILDRRFNGDFINGCLDRICFKDAGLNTDFGKTRWYLTSSAWSQTSFAKGPDIVLKKYKDLPVNWYQTGSDFVYYGPWEKQFSLIDLSKDSNLELVYKNAQVEIFKIKNDVS